MNFNKKGFTLTEMLIATSMGTAAAAMLSIFFLQTVRTTLGIDNNIDIDRSVRNVANEMADIARNANGYIIYESFFERRR